MVMQFGETFNFRGLQLHYSEQGDAAGEAVIFLHGWPDSGSRAAESQNCCQGIPCVPVGPAGFGDQTRPDNGYGIHDFAADVVAFLDATSIERATVVGHSFGSFVAKTRCDRSPRPSESTCAHRYGWLGSNRSHGGLRISRDLADPVPQEFAREFQASTAYAPLPEPFFERIVAESLKLPARLWREVLAGVIRYEDMKELGGIKVPTLLLWGDRDALFPREDQDRLAAAIARARLRVYPEIGHCPNWECPAEVAADLRAFMRSDR